VWRYSEFAQGARIVGALLGVVGPTKGRSTYEVEKEWR
jgi:hypothetical protein